MEYKLSRTILDIIKIIAKDDPNEITKNAANYFIKEAEDENFMYIFDINIKDIFVSGGWDDEESPKYYLWSIQQHLSGVYVILGEAEFSKNKYVDPIRSYNPEYDDGSGDYYGEDKPVHYRTYHSFIEPVIFTIYSRMYKCGASNMRYIFEPTPLNDILKKLFDNKSFINLKGQIDFEGTVYYDSDDVYTTIDVDTYIRECLFKAYDGYSKALEKAIRSYKRKKDYNKLLDTIANINIEVDINKDFTY